MRRRIKPTASQKLREQIFAENIHDEIKIEKMYYDCIEEPDPKEAVKKIKRQMFLRFITSIRDKKKERRPFLYTNKEGIAQIHIIPGTPDIDAVTAIADRLTKRQRGYNKTRKPVRKYQHELEGQTSLKFKEDDNAN